MVDLMNLATMGFVDPDILDGLVVDVGFLLETS